jgi:DNA ligase (NAD+)
MNKRVRELEELILHHKNLYYQGKPQISDEEYDRLEDELRELHPESSALIMVGASVKSDNKIKHEKKMLSLEKTYDLEKLKSWIGSENVLSTFKYDGSACSIVFEERRIKSAKTRGDGVYGENILEKVFFIRDIPKKTNNSKLSISEFEVRGEIFCTEDNFIELSKQMEKSGLDKPMSLRNIVAGLLGRKDHFELAKYLSFTAFEMIISDKVETEEEKLLYLKKLGFNIPDYALCKTWSHVENEVKKCQKFFNEGEFLIDGLVFTYNNSSLAEELGQTSHHPKNKIAFKFQGESKITQIQNIEWNVSRNGRCTPVAIVQPVELSGAVVSRVTLHHYGIVETFQLKPGDEIEIIRSGEVIPKFLRVVNSSNNKFQTIKSCPSCEGKLTVEEHWLKCNNSDCPEKKEQEILYFIKTMGIEEISEMRIKEMIRAGLIINTWDLYRLKEEDFLKLDKVKDKLALKFYEQIQKSKKVELVTLIEALGIEGLGGTKIQKIIDNGVDTLEKFSELKFDEIIKIDGFAEKTANAIILGLKEKSKFLKKLQEVGVAVQKSQNQKESESLKGLKFCITGTLSKPRDLIASDIKNNSGVVQDTVNKETSYLVTNDKESSSSKFVKAKKLGVPIISEDQLAKLIKP